MSIVLKKDGHAKPVPNFEEAQELVNKGWEVWSNKSGKKLVKKANPAKKASKKKVEDE